MYGGAALAGSSLLRAPSPDEPMILVGLAIALATLVPLFLASLVLIQELRRDYPDFVLNLRTAAAIWLGIGIGVAATALVLTRLGLAV